MEQFPNSSISKLTLKVDSLTQKLDSQIDIHERFTNAFIGIASDLRILLDKVSSQGNLSDIDRRDIYKQFLTISQELTELENDMKELKDNIQSQIKELRTITDRLSKEMVQYHEFLEQQIHNVSETIEDNYETTQRNEIQLSDKLKETLEHSKVILSEMKKLRQIIGELSDDSPLTVANHILKISEILEKSKTFFWAAGIFLGTLAGVWSFWQALVQLGIVNNQWFPSGNK